MGRRHHARRAAHVVVSCALYLRHLRQTVPVYISGTGIPAPRHPAVLYRQSAQGFPRGTEAERCGQRPVPAHPDRSRSGRHVPAARMRGGLIQQKRSADHLKSKSLIFCSAGSLPELHCASSWMPYRLQSPFLYVCKRCCQSPGHSSFREKVLHDPAYTCERVYSESVVLSVLSFSIPHLSAQIYNLSEQDHNMQPNDMDNVQRNIAGLFDKNRGASIPAGPSFPQ